MMTPCTPFTPFTPITPFAPVGVPVRVAETKPLTSRDMEGLLRDLAPRVDRVVRAVLGRTHVDADDVVQQAMLGLVRALPQFRGECEPIHFASRVAARIAIAAARRGRALRARYEDGVDVDTFETSRAEPLADAERARRIELVRNALAQIPAEQAEVLALRIVLGWSLAEIAETTCVPLNTVRSRLRLAKTAMRAVIGANPAAQEELATE